MKRNLILFFTIGIFCLGCGEDEPAPNSDDCAGQVCEATPGTNETATTVPATLHGTYNMIITFAESNSPYPEGTRATFTISETRLTITIAGEDCFSIVNPVVRSPFNAPVFKADCIGDIAFQIAANQSGGLEEINMILASGPGYYGQFRVE
ncbi:MAG: hypothetical protein ACI8Q1_003141 [Parvicella sp.]|jgi:hypothetical protein